MQFLKQLAARKSGTDSKGRSAHVISASQAAAGAGETLAVTRSNNSQSANSTWLREAASQGLLSRTPSNAHVHAGVGSSTAQTQCSGVSLDFLRRLLTVAEATLPPDASTEAFVNAALVPLSAKHRHCRCVAWQSTARVCTCVSIYLPRPRTAF